MSKKITKWNGFHSFNTHKTSINVGWSEDYEIFWIRADKYAKSLKYPQTKFLRLLLDHLLKEKIIFATSDQEPSNVNSQDYSKRDDQLPKLNDNLDDLFLDSNLFTSESASKLLLNQEQESINNSMFNKKESPKLKVNDNRSYNKNYH